MSIANVLSRWFGGGSAAADLPGGAVRVASAADVVEGKPFCASAGGLKLSLFRLNGKYYALSNLCKHQGGPLCQGQVVDGAIVCPWHGSTFRIETGQVVKGPAEVAVESYPVELRGGDLYVSLSAPATAGPAPRPAALKFSAELDRERPFSYQPFLEELLAGLKFPFKLYGQLAAVVIHQSPDEIDLHLGRVHVTEQDAKKLSAAMDAVNGKWGTAVTYCLYQTDQFPGVTLLNIRGPKAPNDLRENIRF